MSRLARLAAAALLPLAFAACAISRSGNGGIQNSEFVPVGGPITVRQIGHVGTLCQALPPGPLRIEARPADGIFRVSNTSNGGLTFYYDWAASFGAYQMLFIRFRDGAGNIVWAGEGRCGWWSPKSWDATLYPPGEWPRRQRLDVPAGGHLDIRHDQAALTSWWRMNAPVPPCMMQVRLFGYFGPRTWEPVSADTEWVTATCPGSN